MHREVISAFVAPIKYVWEQEFGSTIKATEIEPVEMEITGDGFTFIAPISGAISGSIGLYLDASTADALSAGMRGRWVSEYEDELQETLIRVVKAMTDASKSLLSKLDINCVIGDITWLEGKNQDFPRPTGEGAEQSVSYLETEFGTISMILSFIDSAVLEEQEANAAREREAWLASLDFVPDDVPDVIRAKRFELVDDDGHTRAVIGRVADGSPHVVLADTDGRMRCAIWLAPNGTPSVAFFDDHGRRSWMAA